MYNYKVFEENAGKLWFLKYGVAPTNMIAIIDGCIFSDDLYRTFTPSPDFDKI